MSSTPLKTTRFTRVGNLNSIQQCLTALGAPRSEVYVRPGPCANPGPGRLRSSIYDRMGGKDVVRSRAATLFRDGMKRCHPDIAGGNPVLENRSKDLTRAYSRAKEILDG